MTTPPAQTPEPVLAVAFDLDDTLYLERDYVRSGYRAVATYLTGLYPSAVNADQWMWKRFCDGDTANMFNAVGEHFALHLTSEQIADLVRRYRTHHPAIEPDRQIAEALRSLRGRTRLGLLSDGFLPAQSYKLEALGLAEMFDAVVFTESMGRDCWKPSPVPFARLAEQLDAPHRACAYVGDNPAKDFLAPNTLGWLTIQWRRDGQIHADKPTPPGGWPQRVARDRNELLAALGLSGG